jgi:hypothetical protein
VSHASLGGAERVHGHELQGAVRRDGGRAITGAAIGLADSGGDGVGAAEGAGVGEVSPVRNRLPPAVGHEASVSWERSATASGTGGGRGSTTPGGGQSHGTIAARADVDQSATSGTATAGKAASSSSSPMTKNSIAMRPSG